VVPKQKQLPIPVLVYLYSLFEAVENSLNPLLAKHQLISKQFFSKAVNVRGISGVLQLYDQARFVKRCACLISAF